MVRKVAWALLVFGQGLVVNTGEFAMAQQTDAAAAATVGVLAQEWIPALPVTAVPASFNACDPVLMRAGSGTLLVAAESRTDEGSSVILARSADGGRTWREPRSIVAAGEGSRVHAGAGGTLPSGRLVLAVSEGAETPGEVAWVAEAPPGVHRYEWHGFRQRSVLRVLISDDDGVTWSGADADLAGGPLAAVAGGRVIQAAGAVWLPVHGPANAAEMDAALGSVGLLRSDDAGATWRFSHWVARADMEQVIGYGPGELTVLPDGRWLGLLQGSYRRCGDYARPRLCRTVSADSGRNWTTPEPELLQPGCSTLTLAGNRIMVGGWKDRGIVFAVGLDAGARWLYQEQVWDCIWYAPGERGGVRLVDLGDNTILTAYHWMSKTDAARTEIRTQAMRQRPLSGEAPGPDRTVPAAARWEMAEARQVPDIADAPAGIRVRTLLKLRSGDWMCLGYVGSRTAATAYGFAPTGFCVLRAARIEGPWRRTADLLVPGAVGDVHDTGTGAGVPSFMVQHSSGRLLVCFSSRQRDDLILTYSDDGGATWGVIGAMTGMTGLPAVQEGDPIVERPDGSLVFPMLAGFLKPGHPLVYVCSADRGETWSAPVPWAAFHPGDRYEGLPHGRADLRESALAILDDTHWLGLYRESRGTPLPAAAKNGPCDMPNICLTRSSDGGRTWKPALGFLGVEPALAALPGGAVLCAYRDDNLASAWISYDRGRTWESQCDPAELPWRAGAVETSTQWPPGGEPIIRVLDQNTAVVICDTGLIPSGKELPAGKRLTRELHGRVQVRYFRRVATAP